MMATKKKTAKKVVAKKTTKKAVAKASKGADETIEIWNVIQPGKTYRVNAAKYAMTRAMFLKVLPKKAPGFTQSEMMAAMRAALPSDQFPGTTSSWWTKSAQLDLEAKGLVVRDRGTPLRWRRK